MNRSVATMALIFVMAILCLSPHPAQGEDPKYKLRNLKPLTESGSYYSDFYWSPDGNMLAMIGGKPRSLYVVQADSPKTLKKLAEGIANSCLAWSPDGKEIAFLKKISDTILIIGKRAASRESKNATFTFSDSEKIIDRAHIEALQIINISNGRIKEAARGASSFGNFTWTRDGIIHLYESGIATKAQYFDRNGNKVMAKQQTMKRVRRDEKGNLYVVNDDGTGKKYITTKGGYPFAMLSPDMTKVISRENNFVVIDIASGKITDLRQNGSGAWWSPDGTSIVYEVMKYDTPDGQATSEGDIYIMDADGNNNTRLTYSPQKIFFEPSVSPNNKRIIFYSEKEQNIYTAILEVKSK
jgi:WD40 repeat protein